MRMFRSFAAVALSLGLTPVVLGQVTGDDFFLEQEVVPPVEQVSLTHFGAVTAISGETAMIGAFNAHTESVEDAGAVFVFERQADDSWSQVQMLSASDAFENANFGDAVSVFGDVAVVGMYKATEIGAAYVFERNGAGEWVEVQKLTASDSTAKDYFGRALSVSGDRIAVGAYGADPAGSVYIFERDPTTGTWLESAILTSSDGDAGDDFGDEVALEGDVLLVAAPDEGGERGSVYCFERDSNGDWIETQKMFASDWSKELYFGFALSMSDDRAVISSLNGPYVFERDEGGSWLEVQKLTVSDAGDSDGYGNSVSISGDHVVVGAYFHNLFRGAAYLFERNQSGDWHEIRKLTSDGSNPGSIFGRSLTISNDTIMCGDADSDIGSNNGSVHIFTMYDVINLDDGGVRYDGLAPALADVAAGDRLGVRSSAFDIDGILNTDVPLTFIAAEPIEFGADLMFLPADGTSFVDSSDVADAGFTSFAQLVAPEEGQLVFSSLDFEAGSQFHHNESTLLVNEGLTTSGGSAYLSGNLLAASVSTGAEGTNRVAGDTNLFCDYMNAGMIALQRGILYVYGDLVHNGTIVGELGSGFSGGGASEPGDGISIGGNCAIGQGATLSMADPIWWLRVGDDFDVAIDDASRFSMAEATIELNGFAPGSSQMLEALSDDLGADEAGFESSNFPIGVLRITSDSTTYLVNNHANSSNDACEVLYVNELVLASGGELITNGCPIYARVATIDGVVDDPEAIIIVGGCSGDVDGNDVVDGFDVAFVLGTWATSDPLGDVNDDGIVDGADLLIVISDWGVCP